MAKLFIQLLSTGDGFEITDVDLNHETPRQLIDKLIVYGALEYGCPYELVNEDDVKISLEELDKTLEQLGVADGDVIRIIVSASENVGVEASTPCFTFEPSLPPQASSHDEYSYRTFHLEEGKGYSQFYPFRFESLDKFAEQYGLSIEEAEYLIHKIQKENQEELYGKEVYSSIFAPAEVKRKSHMLIQVYLHLFEDVEKVKSLAKESDKNAERRDYIPLQCKLKRGDKVDVLLSIYGETLLMSDKKSVVWQGSFTKCSFDYLVPKDIDVDELSCVALLTVNEIPVGEMRFITRIVESPRQLNPEIIAHKYNKAFISYAHKDEAKVKSFHEGLKLAGIEHFFDRAYLKTGDIFPQVIQDYINSADLFVLFWSENAALSDYVRKERTQALELAFPQVKPQQEAKLSIYPMSIEPRAELPSDMKDYYHFGEL